MGKMACWLNWPPGHLYESVTYRDPVSGRWRAYARCLRCNRLRRLSVGDRKRPANFPGNPLAMLLAFGSRPADATMEIEHVEPRGSMIVDVPPTGEKLEIRAALVAWGPWRGATVYCARRLGSGRQAASRDLRAAVARASGTKDEAPWVDDLARQLEHELAP
ncbi:MAG TPA: hypothetical protein VMR48_02575 [Gaiellaceae bacterium]|jgi:hypothetical protein|nr:hypothetical protein [Gaiellaceae bacterium]